MSDTPTGESGPARGGLPTLEPSDGPHILLRSRRQTLAWYARSLRLQLWLTALALVALVVVVLYLTLGVTHSSSPPTTAAPPRTTITTTVVPPPPAAVTDTVDCATPPSLTVTGTGTGKTNTLSVTGVGGDRQATGSPAVITLSGPAGQYSFTDSDSGGSPSVDFTSGDASCVPS